MNYNQTNMTNIKKSISNPNHPYLLQTYNLLQNTSRQKVTITKSSRNKCVKGLIR